jgi:hypothetical protein
MFNFVIPIIKDKMLTRNGGWRLHLLDKALSIYYTSDLIEEEKKYFLVKMSAFIEKESGIPEWFQIKLPPT